MAGKRGTFSHVKAIAEKKSQVRNLVENFQTMDESDIMSSSVSGWIKNIILKEKEKINAREIADKERREFLESNGIAPGEELTPEDIAKRMMDMTRNENNTYPYGEYNGPIVTLGKSIVVDIMEGPLMFMDNNWIKTPYGAYETPKEKYDQMLLDTTIEGSVTPKEFSAIVNSYHGIKFESF